MADDKLKALLGIALLLASSTIILFVSSQGHLVLPGIVGAVAVVLVATGTLLTGQTGTDSRVV